MASVSIVFGNAKVSISVPPTATNVYILFHLCVCHLVMLVIQLFDYFSSHKRCLIILIWTVRQKFVIQFAYLLHQVNRAMTRKMNLLNSIKMMHAIRMDGSMQTAYAHKDPVHWIYRAYNQAHDEYCVYVRACVWI